MVCFLRSLVTVLHVVSTVTNGQLIPALSLTAGGSRSRLSEHIERAALARKGRATQLIHLFFASLEQEFLWPVSSFHSGSHMATQKRIKKEPDKEINEKKTRDQARAQTHSSYSHEAFAFLFSSQSFFACQAPKASWLLCLLTGAALGSLLRCYMLFLSLAVSLCAAHSATAFAASFAFSGTIIMTT